MPIRKKSPARKKLDPVPVSDVAKAADPLADVAKAADPSTVIEGNGAIIPVSDGKAVGKGKKKPGKKKRKKRVGKTDKALTKLNKDADKFRSSKSAYYAFLCRMDQWLAMYCLRATELLRQYDDGGDGTVSMEEFKLGMLDLSIPCSTIELHLLAMLLDRDNTGDIDYMHLFQGLHHIRKLEQYEAEEEAADTVLLTQRNFDHCPKCKLAIQGPYIEKHPRYLLAHLRLVTFDNLKDHPLHFTAVIHSHITVYSLIQEILQRTEILSSKLAVFSDQSRTIQALLSSDMTLEECGYLGGSCDDPEECTLYYDYAVEFTNCPLLMCDHYFAQKSSAVNKLKGWC